MKERFKNALLGLVKDYGLSDKAIDELAEQAIAGIPQDAGDEAVQQTANLYANIARAMQGEVTRKVQQVRQAQQQPHQQQQQEDKPTPKGMDEETRKALEALRQQVKELADANAKARAEAEAQAKAAQHRQLVKESAARLGLPHSIALSIDTSKAETAEDVEKALADFQQQLVNEQLAPKGVSATLLASEEAAMKAGAEAFAESL